MSKFRRKQHVVEAFKWSGDPNQTEDPEWIVQALKENRVFFKEGYSNNIFIITPMGERKIYSGDYIVRNDNGDLYGMNGISFEKDYEPDNKEELVDAVKELIC
jgi:hypothetical protein